MRGCLALLLALLAGPAFAQAVPPPLRGAWYAGDCADPAALLVLTARAAARLEAEAPSRLYRFATTTPLGAHVLGVGVGAEAPRLMFRAVPQGLETIEPDPKTRDDRLPGTAQPETWRRCAAPPPGLSLLHGEGVAFLAALEHLEAACGAGTPGACAAALIAQGDVSGDGRLSAAELARLMRGAAWLLAVQDGGAAETIAVSLGGGALAAILAARLLVESLDYDGDGRLSAAELLQDRAGGFAGAAGAEAGRALRLEGFAGGAELLRGLIEGLLAR